MKLEIVPIEYVHVVWKDVAPMIEPAMEFARGEYTLEQLLGLISSGTWVLLVITSDTTIHGAVVVNVFNRPNDRVAFIQAIGGKDVVTEDLFDQLKVYAARWGATAVECAARPSMERLLKRIGMKPKYTVLEVPNE